MHLLTYIIFIHIRTFLDQILHNMQVSFAHCSMQGCVSVALQCVHLMLKRIVSSSSHTERLLDTYICYIHIVSLLHNIFMQLLHICFSRSFYSRV